MNEHYGLLFSKSGGPVPLMEVKVEGDVVGRGAKVKIFQRFKNEEHKAVEAVYKFPLPDGAAVCGFSADIDGKKIQGQVEERDKAFEIYDDALSRGDGSYLLDEERPNIFTLSVGNLNPNAEVMVEIEYVSLLDAEGRQVRFFLPTTISPRYIPDEMIEDDGIPEDSKLHPPYSAIVPYGLSISLNIHKGSLLESIDSPSHNIKIDNMKGDPVNISFSNESVRMDRDFVLNMEYESAFASRAYRYRTDKETFLQLDLMLESEKKEVNDSKNHDQDEKGKEIILVLDCSGSMSGDSIHEAKRALEICLRSLSPSTTFNIYRFGSDYESLFKTAEKYSGETLEEALDYLQRAQADLGGTEILSPLTSIYSDNCDNGSIQRSIVLLTDGEVANEEDIFELVRKNQASTEVFPLGIGAGCNEFFIKGLARAGRGASEFIYPGERIEPKVLRLFNKLTQKGLNNPVIDWGINEVAQAPFAPVIFSESPITVFARCTDEDPITEGITIRGDINGHEKELVIDIVDLNDEGLPAPILWARERIRDFEESRGDLEKKGSRQTDRRGDRWKDSVLELSKKYGVLSQITSYLALEEREEKDKTTGELVLRKVPVPVTIGWHGIGRIFGSGKSGVIYNMAAPQIKISESRDFSAMSLDGVANEEFDYTVRFNVAEDKTDIVLSILSLQKAEGGMLLNEKVSKLLGIKAKKIKKISAYIEVEIEVDKFLLLSTAILLQFLEIYLLFERKTWAKIIKKSRDWMIDVIHEGRPTILGKDLMSWVEEFVRNDVRLQK